MNLFQFVIIRFLFLLIFGVLIAYYFPFDLENVCLVSVLFFTFFFFVFLIKRLSNYLFDTCAYISVILIGVLSLTFHKHSNHLKHYSNNIDNDKAYMKVHIFKELKSNSKNNKYLAKILYFNETQSSGILLINVDSSLHVKIDDIVYLNSKLHRFNKANNPHQFDYKEYMRKNNVYHQVFVNSFNAIQSGKTRSFYGIAHDIRNKINITLKKYSLSRENLSIVNALFLGQRNDVSKENYSSFSKSGAIHVLAISGLHIGLLTSMLLLLLQPLRVFKFGKVCVPILIIFLLWCYAFLAGMSSSVVRAVTMFSIITIGLSLKRETNTYNTLAISAFILLLFNPYYLFDIGFQLSYLAVFAIVWVKPLFDKIYTPKNIIIKKLYDVFALTFSVQFGILPLSLFYFHQFPGLFFVSNIVIIPFLFLLLLIGIVCLVFAYYGWIPEYLFNCFDQSISILIHFVKYISSKEIFIFSNIPFNTFNLIGWYFFIFCFILFLKSFSYKRLILLLISLVTIQLSYIFIKKESSNNSFVVFNQYKKTLIGKKLYDTLYFYSKDTLFPKVLNAYVVNEFVNTTIKNSLKNVYSYGDFRILLVDERGVYKTSFSSDIIILSNSPKINLERLINEVCPKLIVADNSNYSSFLKHWSATCAINNVPFYNIKERGAFIIK